MNQLLCLCAALSLTSCTMLDRMRQITPGSEHVSLIPRKDLAFTVKRSPHAVDVIISAAKWDIQGFGTGINGATGRIIIDSVCGLRSSAASTRTHHFHVPDGRTAQVLFIDATGRESPLGTATQP